MSAPATPELALFGGPPVRDPAETPWPPWPVFGQAEREGLLETLESGQWRQHERVARFEKVFASLQDARRCLACTSGTTALEVAIDALDLAPGDEVIVPSYTFAATASAALRMGARVVFADVDATWRLDPDAAERAIGPGTRAMVPVHFGSGIADMDRLSALADRRGLKIIEDACHAWGAKWRGKGAGALGHAGVFSFYGSKNVAAGEGGAITSDDEAYMDRCWSIINCGRAKDGPWYYHESLGTNARITEFTGALLLGQLSRLDDHTARREANAAILNEALGAIEGLTPQPGDERITRRAYHLYCIRLDPESFGCSRERFVAAAQAEGLPVTPGYPLPLHEQPVFKNHPGCRAEPCPVATDLCYNSGLWFAHPILLGSEADMEAIIAIAEKVKRNAGRLAE